MTQACQERNRLVQDFAEAEAAWITVISKRDSLLRNGVTSQQVAERIAQAESRRMAADQAGIQHCAQHGCASWTEVLDLSLVFRTNRSKPSR